ncbi:hypothetical protein RFI_22681 [Reticulomyxa filosa]|uniref:Uncharacterized protein n=1 Tax=Reticulomyxa filosa TaxID=46433 RepID=X6MLD2_RETFI|nr:hypothetical protein RFI_22681 [Reticulomyxa filosa]|eukprot:ETO14689.1 hypothetical protein RFI_22681 [Reticulomyxa filosa]
MSNFLCVSIVNKMSFERVTTLEGQVHARVFELFTYWDAQIQTKKRMKAKSDTNNETKNQILIHNKTKKKLKKNPRQWRSVQDEFFFFIFSLLFVAKAHDT